MGRRMPKSLAGGASDEEATRSAETTCSGEERDVRHARNRGAGISADPTPHEAEARRLRARAHLAGGAEAHPGPLYRVAAEATSGMGAGAPAGTPPGRGRGRARRPGGRTACGQARRREHSVWALDDVPRCGNRRRITGRCPGCRNLALARRRHSRRLAGLEPPRRDQPALGWNESRHPADARSRPPTARGGRHQVR